MLELTTSSEYIELPVIIETTTQIYPQFDDDFASRKKNLEANTDIHLANISFPDEFLFPSDTFIYNMLTERAQRSSKCRE
jgi:hypothetical protein